MKEAVIVAAARTAVGKAGRGALADVRSDDMLAAVLQELLRRASPLPAGDIDDLILGCAMPEKEQGTNLARVALTRAGFPHTVPGQTINRFCSSGLQSIALGAQQIMCGMASCVIGAGVESMSMLPITGALQGQSPWLVEHDPQIYTPMGQTAENVAREYRITRADQDAFAYQSHMRAIAAQDGGRFKEDIVPLDLEQVVLDSGKPTIRTSRFDVDEGPRRDTTPEALAKLRPAFARDGTVTAGNSSQTSDGAAAVLLMARDKAEALGLRPLARFVSFAVGGVPAEVMGIGPVVAIPKALRLAGLSLADIGLIELNEAFASQALAVIRELGLDENVTNVNGGAIALGHPLGCSGAKLTVQILREMKLRKVQFGLVSMCIGGGMGAAGVFESLN